MTHSEATGSPADCPAGPPTLLEALRAARDAPAVQDGDQNDQAPFKSKPQRESYSEAAKHFPLRQEAAVLLVMTLVSTLAVARLSVALTPAERGWLLIGYGALPLACLALLKARPAAYRRHLFWLAWMHHSVLGIAHQLVDITPALQFSLPALQSSGVAGMLAWLAMLFLVTATNPGIPMLLCFQLPPVAMAASACCMAAAFANMNGRVCASPLLQLPESAQRLEAYYRLLEPLIAPLEPLLLAAGLGRTHQRRHCLSVLAAQQFWLVAMLPTLLVALQQVRAYRRWRVQRRQLAREWRQQQAEAWNFPFKEPSSSSAGGSSKDGSDGNGHSRHSRRSSSSTGSERSHGQHGGGGGGPPPLALVPLSSQLPLAYRRQLVVTRAAPARIHTQPHHPDDWQYEVAERALRALRPTYASAAVVLLVAAVGGTWHQQAFP